MSKQEVLDQVDSSYAELESALENVGEDRAAEEWYGKWNVKQVVGHMIGWDREMTGALERAARGERPTPEGVDYNDVDTWNEKFSAEHSEGLIEEVRVRLDDAHQSLRSALDAVDEERFAEGKTAHRIAYATAIDHYKEHAGEIKNWISQ